MNDKIGIVGYGAYVPRWRIKVEEIARIWGQDPNSIRKGLLVEEKAVADSDEDTITISIEAARNAMLRAQVGPQQIGALFIGSESHPYAVKPSGTVVAEALGMGPNISIVDTQFACVAGTASMFICMGLTKSKLVEYGMAIGADTAQSKPGDALEYTAAAGGAAFVIGRDGILAEIEGWNSYVTDTPDFWRRAGQTYPAHAGRFTGDPAYFKHVTSAARGLMEKLGTNPDDYDYVAFHMPNGKFPLRAAKELGFDEKKLLPGLVVTKIGNTYAGSSLLALCAILDIAKPGQRIFVTSYGSGAGSDSFSLMVTDAIEEKRSLAPPVNHYIERKSYIDYGTYIKLTNLLRAR